MSKTTKLVLCAAKSAETCDPSKPCNRCSLRRKPADGITTFADTSAVHKRRQQARRLRNKANRAAAVEQATV